jgi:crotonobetainyl-CoA:carnitine CoA-transferase CaiB-like acyl-CoA transferase
MTLFAAVVLALFDRERTGRGRRVTTSLLACGAWANATTIQAKLIGATFHPRRRREETLNFGAVYYRSRDGRVFKFAIVDWPKTFPAFCRAAGRPDLIEDPRYSTAEARADRMGELVGIFDRQFAEQDLDHWLTAFAEHDVPCSVLSTYDDIAVDRQFAASGVFVEVEHPQLGAVRSVASPIRLEHAALPAPVAAPRLGQHTKEILRSVGVADSDIEQLLRQRVAIG